MKVRVKFVSYDGDTDTANVAPKSYNLGEGRLYDYC